MQDAGARGNGDGGGCCCCKYKGGGYRPLMGGREEGLGRMVVAVAAAMEVAVWQNHPWWLKRSCGFGR